MSYNLNSRYGGYIGDYVGDYYRAYTGGMLGAQTMAYVGLRRASQAVLEHRFHRHVGKSHDSGLERTIMSTGDETLRLSCHGARCQEDDIGFRVYGLGAIVSKGVI